MKLTVESVHQWSSRPGAFSRESLCYVLRHADNQARHTPRSPHSKLTILASRDRGFFQRDFTLQAFAPQGVSLNLERISSSFAFSQRLVGQLNTRNSGGHPGTPTHGLNPNYRCIVSPSGTPGGRNKTEASEMRVVLHGDKEVAWNVKLVWGGERVFE
jgi:calpain-7